MRRRHSNHQLSAEKDFSLTILSLPTLLWYAAFCYVPMAGIVMAFKRYRLVPGKGFFYSLFFGSKWVGLENFRFLFLNPRLGQVIRNTLLYNLVFLVLGIVVPVALAIALAYLHQRWVRSLVRVSLLLPYFMSWIIVSYFVYGFLSPDRGILNALLSALGAETVSFYREPGLWPFLLCLIQLWKASGYTMLLYYARIMSIDTQIIDNATVDGASAGQMIRHIILPEMKSIIVIMTLLNLGHIFSTDFGLFYQVTRNAGSILSTTETIDVFVYKALLEQADYGFSAAAGLLQNVIGFVTLLIANAVIGRYEPEGRII